MKNIIAHLKKEEYFSFLYLACFFLSFHSAIMVYVNSSFLATLVGDKYVGAIYIVGSLLTVVLLLNISKFLKNFGNWHTTVALSLIEAIALFILASVSDPFILVFFFLLHQAVALLLFFNLDIFLETALKPPTHVGGTRGIFLAFSNLAYVVAPFIAGLLLVANDYRNIYLAALAFLFPFFLIILLRFNDFKDSRYSTPIFVKNLQIYFKNKNLRDIFFANLILQIFYAVMVIYMPLYLNQTLAFSWPAIGLMYSIALLPFIIFQIPGGLLADTKLGEKKMMIGGFLIMGTATLLLPFLKADFVPWVVLLFMTRVGAAIVEIMTESYFFKHVQGKDSSAISLFRTTAPFGLVVTPIIVTSLFVFTSFPAVLLLLSFLLFWGIRYAMEITA